MCRIWPTYGPIGALGSRADGPEAHIAAAVRPLRPPRASRVAADRATPRRPWGALGGVWVRRSAASAAPADETRAAGPLATEQRELASRLVLALARRRQCPIRPARTVTEPGSGDGSHWARAAERRASDPALRAQPLTGESGGPVCPAARRAVAADIERLPATEEADRVVARGHPDLGEPAAVDDVVGRRAALGGGCARSQRGRDDNAGDPTKWSGHRGMFANRPRRGRDIRHIAQRLFLAMCGGPSRSKRAGCRRSGRATERAFGACADTGVRSPRPSRGRA